MAHSSELEQMVNLLAFAAEVMRKLAEPQTPDDRATIRVLADDLDGVAEKLIDVLFPQRVRTCEPHQRTEPTKPVD